MLYQDHLEPFSFLALFLQKIYFSCKAIKGLNQHFSSQSYLHKSFSESYLSFIGGKGDACNKNRQKSSYVLNVLLDELLFEVKEETKCLIDP